MKSLSLFAKIFIFLSFGTFVFIVLTFYSVDKALKSDPELLVKIGKYFNMNISTNGFYFNGITDPTSPAQPTRETWTFAVPKKKIQIKSVAGNLTIKETSGKEILISADGQLHNNSSGSSHLLEIKLSGDDLIIQESENFNQANWSSQDLEIQIEIPGSFLKTLEASSVSGNLVIENLNLDKLELKTTSGQVILKQVLSKSLILKTVSGELMMDESSISNISAKSISGNMELSNLIPANVELTSLSGNLKLKLTEIDKAQISLKSISGNIQNSQNQKAHGKAQGNFQINISTASGDIEVK